MGLEDLIKQKALESGAGLCGIAPAPLPEQDPDPRAYREWLDQGRHGAMGYMERQPHVRQDITRWYPDARSVILCAFSYWNKSSPPHPHLPLQEGKGDFEMGRIARYALGEDYHGVLRKKLKELLAWLGREKPGARGRIFLDTSPVLERRYARYAGIGWIGKNTMLLNPRIGSYFFLGGLAVNVALRPDDPVPDHCGACNRCLTACPTGAFPQPRTLDASRCIAYFTIEHRGAIPEEFREKIGNRVFGCDICQEVCPWNRFAVQTPVREFAPQWNPAPSLGELARLSENDFRSRLKKTPMERAGRKGLLRNTLLAMGNSGNKEFFSILRDHENHTDPTIREQALWSLKKIKTQNREQP